MTKQNDWGIAQAPVTPPATTTPSATTGAVVGVVGGGVVGGLLGTLFKKPLLGAGIGAVAGGIGGYAYSSNAATAAAAAGTPTATGTLPAGPYKLLPNAVQGGTVLGPSLQPGGTYLLSGQGDVSPLATALSGLVTEIQQSGMTVLGAWSGFPPSGWPANDPNAAGGIFVALKNTSPSVDPTPPLGTDVAVFAVGSTPTPTPTPNLPTGPYAPLGANAPMNPSETYLLSASGAAASALSVSLNNPAATVLTVLGTWSGKPPTGWPSADTTAPGATSIYAAVTIGSVTTGGSATINPGAGVNVFAVNGLSS